MQKFYKFSLIISMAFLLILITIPQAVYAARWPPFDYTLTPRYENGRIIYELLFIRRVKSPLTQVTIKIPLPEGTRYLEGSAQATTSVTFDGAEITFFSSVLNEDIRVASFIVEVTDPAQKIFTARTWISWLGEQPGSFWAEDTSIDITKPMLDWMAPPPPSLQLRVLAEAADDTITYSIYPRNVSIIKSLRMQDVKINIPIPEGTTYLSAEATPPFTANLNGQEISFTALELERLAAFEPLKVKVSTKETSAPFVSAHAWASWKNTGRRVGINVVPQEELTTGDIIVRPHVLQWVVSDRVGNVPFSNYDLTNLALEDDGTAVKIGFYLAGNSGPLDVPLTFLFFIDSDCSNETGLRIGGIGADYRIKYKTDYSRADIESWAGETSSWTQFGRGAVTVESPPSGQAFTVILPYDLIGNNRQFCWAAQSYNRTTTFNTILPYDLISSDDLPLEFYQFNGGNAVPVVTAVAPEPVIENKPTRGSFISSGDAWQFLPGWSEPPANWPALGFNDRSWFSGPTSIGYGKGKHATDLAETTFQQGDAPIMVQRAITEAGVILAVPVSGATSASVFMRHSFTVDTPAALTKLELAIKYQGGFVAYLNGSEVVRRGVGVPGASVFYDTLAADQSDKVTETIDLSLYIDKLVPGVNVLAVQAHRSQNSTTLSITPKLTWASNPKVNLFEVNNSLPSPAETSAIPVAAPSITDIRGKLAVPLKNDHGLYDTHIFSLPDRQGTLKIPNARQPNFRFDGQRLLINREGGGVENMFEYDLVDGTESQVSDAPGDSHPFYDPAGNRVVYGNPELVYGKPEKVYDSEKNKVYFTGVFKPFIFVQCGLLPPHQEQEPRCRDIPTLGVLIPAGQLSELQGTNPVWTSNDMIAYKGCNSWSGFSACGIYLVPSSSTKGFSDGFIPRQITKDTSDTPTDTKGNLIAFMSQRDGNWEAYVMNLDGTEVRNLSNSPDSNDGLPTISPDANWVAFVSDRGGSWAIWVAPLTGGQAQKVFDLPTTTPWGEGNWAWDNERISWGP